VPHLLVMQKLTLLGCPRYLDAERTLKLSSQHYADWRPGRMDVLHGLPKGSLKGSKTSQQSDDIVVGQIFIKLQFTKHYGVMLAILLSCSTQLI